jgi:hypothetical protein
VNVSMPTIFMSAPPRASLADGTVKGNVSRDARVVRVGI